VIISYLEQMMPPEGAVKPLSKALPGGFPDKGLPMEGLAQTQSEPVRKARPSVLVADYLADRLITLGGITVLVAVLGIVLFLVGEVIPLFQGARILKSLTYQIPAQRGTPGLLGVDEQGAIGFGMTDQGHFFAFHAPSGTPLGVPPAGMGEMRPTAWAFSQDKEHLAIGFADGTVRLGTLRVSSELRPPDEVPSGLRDLGDGHSTDGTAIYMKAPGGEMRVSRLELSIGEPRKVSEKGLAILGLDYRMGGTEERPTRSLAALDEEMGLWVQRVELRKNLLTGQVKETIQTGHAQVPASNKEAVHLLLGGHGNMVVLITRHGELFRLDMSKPQGEELVERSRLGREGLEITAAAFLSGERSLVLGGSDGSMGVWFLVEDPKAKTLDGRTFVLARELDPQPGAILGIEPGMRGKTLASWDSTGEIWVRHATSEKILARVAMGTGTGARVALAPRLDALMAMGSGGSGGFWKLEGPHPETSFSTLFGKIWYEGSPQPEFVWQSSGGSEDFEPKLSLIPLIFGTLKGALYSLLFAVPIAILGAIYTSEFLAPGVRSMVKPVMEMMASLPSVILGFVAALVLAPVVEHWISSVLLAFLVVPLGLLLAGCLFQTIPEHLSRSSGVLGKLLIIACVMGLWIWISMKTGPIVEEFFFGGDLKAWLSGGGKGVLGPLFLLLSPVGMLVSAICVGRHLWPRAGGAWGELARALGVFLGGCLVSLGLACALQWAGVDPRDGLVGTYVQRNTLVVAFAMGFAVVPLIYTLAEEALSGVPDHLRAASLSCGATPWQTALWVVLPTAASGVFSAVMIGMGRAVGETMIVVMAAGNTPLMDLNLFNGFRALSANIAVELPEAVRGGTLYRVLFLSALVLFSITLVINTAAELVRQRFRRRAQQL
jgi:phosphate transport system permease protein